MRFTRQIWLLSLLLTSCSNADRVQGNKHANIFQYRTIYGQKAVFNLENMAITYNEGTVNLTDCSDEYNICFVSDKIKIVVPKKCPNDTDLKYISSGYDLEIMGLEGLTGNVVKRYVKNKKFAYSYHPSNGLVSLTIFPSLVNKNVYESGELSIKYTYYIPLKKAPLRCRPYDK